MFGILARAEATAKADLLVDRAEEVRTRLKKPALFTRIEVECA
jgi:hypothetical protein